MISVSCSKWLCHYHQVPLLHLIDFIIRGSNTYWWLELNIYFKSVRLSPRKLENIWVAVESLQCCKWKSFSFGTYYYHFTVLNVLFSQAHKDCVFCESQVVDKKKCSLASLEKIPCLYAWYFLPDAIATL